MRIALERGENIEGFSLVSFDRNNEIFKIRILHDEKRATEHEMTPLISAVKRGLVDVVEYLLTLGVNPNLCHPRSLSPIQVAAGEGNGNIVELLIKAGAKVNDNHGDERSTPLIIASEKGHVAVVDFLLSFRETDREAIGKKGRTALMWACEEERLLVVDRLLKVGCDVNAQDEDGATALIRAVAGNRSKVIDSLLRHSLDFSLKNRMGETALMLVCDRRDYHLARRFMRKRCDVNCQDNEGKTSLMRAASLDDFKLVKLLMYHGADAFLFDNHGKRAFDYSNPFSCFQTLIDCLFPPVLPLYLHFSTPSFIFIFHLSSSSSSSSFVIPMKKFACHSFDSQSVVIHKRFNFFPCDNRRTSPTIFCKSCGH